ncbi:MAG: hypothetical protein AAF331_00735 [Pseudomonadota bacterium]
MRTNATGFITSLPRWTGFTVGVCTAALCFVSACERPDRPKTGCDYYYPDFTTLELKITSNLSEGVYATAHECIERIEFSSAQIKEIGLDKLGPACQFEYYGDFEYTTRNSVSNVLALTMYSECGFAYDSVSGADFFESKTGDN